MVSVDSLRGKVLGRCRLVWAGSLDKCGYPNCTGVFSWVTKGKHMEKYGKIIPYKSLVQWLRLLRTSSSFMKIRNLMLQSQAARSVWSPATSASSASKPQRWRGAASGSSRPPIWHRRPLRSAASMRRTDGGLGGLTQTDGFINLRIRHFVKFRMIRFEDEWHLNDRIWRCAMFFLHSSFG